MNFLKPESENMGGSVFFYFIPSSEVSGFTKTSDYKVSSLVLQSGSDLSAGYASPNSLVFQATPSETEHGTVFDILIKGFYPRPGYQMMEIFSDMVNERFIVLVKDNNGNSRIAGTIDQPLSFRFSESSAQRAQEMPGIEYQFYGKVATLPFFYTSSLEYPSLSITESDPLA